MKLTGGQVIAKTLASQGIRYFFYVTGGMPFSFYDAIEAEGIKMVLCRNEKGACTAAEGYSRLTNTPSVCYSQHGAAAAILGSMLYEASYNHTPVIALTGSFPLSVKDRWLYQDCYEMPYFESTCKYSVDIADVSRLSEYLRNAVQTAVAGCPGPTHASIKSNMPGQLLDSPKVYRERHPLPVPSYRPTAERDRVVEAAKLLAGAEMPVILCGSGVHLSQAYSELLELATLLSIPVAVNLKGRGAFPEDHPLFFGITGSYGIQLTNDIIREADVVFFLGTRADPHTTDGLTAPQPGGSKIIHLDIDPTVINRNYQADIPLVGDLRATLTEIIAALRTMALKRPDTERLRNMSAMLEAYYSSLKSQTESRSTPIKPQRLVQAVADLLGPKDIVVSDTGHMLCWTAQMMRLKGTGRVYIPCGGTLGSSFGEAIGAAFGAGKGQRVVNMIGDGGFAYNLGELETLKRYSHEIAPFVVVVNNNSSFAQSRSNYKDQVERNRGRIKTTDFTDVDFAKVAEGFGLRGITVERASELDEALRGALRAGSPAVVDVKTSKFEYPVSRPYFPR
jgi:acetolactate synthase-1/2/3 large subunit